MSPDIVKIGRHHLSLTTHRNGCFKPPYIFLSPGINKKITVHHSLFMVSYILLFIFYCDSYVIQFCYVFFRCDFYLSIYLFVYISSIIIIFFVYSSIPFISSQNIFTYSNSYSITLFYSIYSLHLSL